MVDEKQKLHARMEKAMAEYAGERCETKDTDDFPELKDGNGRCFICLAYEKLDNFIASL